MCPFIAQVEELENALPSSSSEQDKAKEEESVLDDKDEEALKPIATYLDVLHPLPEGCDSTKLYQRKRRGSSRFKSFWNPSSTIVTLFSTHRRFSALDSFNRMRYFASDVADSWHDSPTNLYRPTESVCGRTSPLRSIGTALRL